MEMKAAAAAAAVKWLPALSPRHPHQLQPSRLHLQWAPTQAQAMPPQGIVLVPAQGATLLLNLIMKPGCIQLMMNIMVLHFLLNFSPFLKGVFVKNERGYRLNAIKKRFWSLLILLLAVASIRRKLLKNTNTEERSVLTNSERCNIQLDRKQINLISNRLLKY